MGKVASFEPKSKLQGNTNDDDKNQISKQSKANSEVPKKDDDFKNSLAAMLARGKPQKKKKPQPEK